MLKLILQKLPVLPYTWVYLNTSHVKVNLVIVGKKLRPLFNLNTSHVKVNRLGDSKANISRYDLNTSHVKVNQNFGYRIVKSDLFKYISC